MHWKIGETTVSMLIVLCVRNTHPKFDISIFGKLRNEHRLIDIKQQRSLFDVELYSNASVLLPVLLLFMVRLPMLIQQLDDMIVYINSRRREDGNRKVPKIEGLHIRQTKRYCPKDSLAKRHRR